MVEGKMPNISFGPYSLSRLVLGANPINAGSHLSRFVDMQMQRFFTEERVLELLWHCQHLGINTWQSSPMNLDIYQKFQEQGGQMHYISLVHNDPDDSQMLESVVAAGAIAGAHHGEFTDRLWKSGKVDAVREYCKRIRDAGLMVGVSTHIPDVVDHIISQDWDIDFLMCCVYERHRTREELQTLLGEVPIRIPEVYLESDPARMFKAMRQTDKPCLAFKILAAGRLCERQETVEQAFRSTFEQMKPTDAVIVGIYPEYEDQATINAEYVRRFSTLSHG